MATELHATMEATIRLFISSYEEAVRQTDPSLLSKATSADCIRSTAPAALLRSIGADPAATFDNASYAAHMAPQLAAMEEGRCAILSTSVDTVKKSAVARVEHHCKVPAQDSVCLEFCWILDFTEDGKAIRKVVEFVDSKGIMGFMGMLHELAGGHGAGSGEGCLTRPWNLLRQLASYVVGSNTAAS